MNIQELTDIAKEAAFEAGKEILKIYHSMPVIESQIKSDGSPLTLADKAAHNKIVEYLSKTNIPVLSEEGVSIDYNERKNWNYLWIVDPLDGTKEFIKKNNEFTVNIALVNNGKPILGVVYAPALELMYYGNKEKGAFKSAMGGLPKKLDIPSNKEINTIVASRSHMSEETKEFINQYPNAEIISMGSSLKFMLVAEDKAQLYPRFAPTMEWDTAAAQAIVEAAGGFVHAYPEKIPLSYNRENLLNGWFLVR